jgi:D-alanyl-D-alanine carboxypeptidase
VHHNGWEGKPMKISADRPAPNPPSAVPKQNSDRGIQQIRLALLGLSVGWVLIGCLPVSTLTGTPDARGPLCTAAQPFAATNQLAYLPLDWKGTGESIEGSLEPRQIAALEAALDQIMALSGATGVTAAVAIPARGRWAGVRGLARRTPPQLLKPDDRLAVGSVTKLWTATLVMQLVEAGKLSLETPIARWFPDFPNAGVITVNHLLTHTAGVSSVQTAPQPGEAQYRSPETWIAEARTHGNLFCPGSAWSYSNMGYVMLGRIVELESGMPFSAVLKARLVQPLGLTHTDFQDPGFSTVARVDGHSGGKALETPVDYAMP